MIHLEEALYCLMHRNDPVCTVSIDTISGTMLRVSRPTNPELLPPGGSVDAETLRKWWHRRAVPISQGKIKRILESLGLSTPQEYLVKNLGLSLTDHYWIKPLEIELDWDDINLYTNNFRDPVGDMQFENTIPNVTDDLYPSYSPSSSTQGDLSKKWMIQDGKRFLIKGNHGGNSQESLNEILATLIHQKQGIMPFVLYTPVSSPKTSQIFCMCESFTSADIEFIPAIDMVNSQKRNNSTSFYEHFIQVCGSHKLDESAIRDFLEYQILTDFIMTNTDRHLNNFGVLRNAHSLQYEGMAPIFDSGNSMFRTAPRLPEYDDLSQIEVNSFRGTESKLLQLVKNKSLVDLSLLPAENELRAIYNMDPLISYTDQLILGYTKKIHILEQML